MRPLRKLRLVALVVTLSLPLLAVRCPHGGSFHQHGSDQNSSDENSSDQVVPEPGLGGGGGAPSRNPSGYRFGNRWRRAFGSVRPYHPPQERHAPGGVRYDFWDHRSGHLTP